MKLLKKLLSTFIVMLVVMTSITVVEAKALSNGVYVAPISVDYKNPETGLIEDGGSEENYELGLSMCKSIVGSQALIEVENGKKYVTLRLSLISNISNVNIGVQGSSRGSYYNVSTEVTKTGNDTKDYRFQIIDENLYISPTLYVTPMGRSVKFFIKFNVQGAASGSGDFVTKIQTTTNSNSQNDQGSSTESGYTNNNSEQVTQSAGENSAINTQEITVSNEDEADSVQNEEVEEEIPLESEDYEISIDDAEGTSEHDISTKTVSSKNNSKSKSNKVSIITISSIVLVSGISGVVTYKKFKKR